MDTFLQRPALSRLRRHPVTLTMARFAVVLGPLLLAVAVLSACRQQPTPRPLPDPITFSTPKTLGGSALRPQTVALPTP